MSRQYFDFSSLITDYENDFVVVTHTKAGYNAAGDWVEETEAKETMRGAIIGFKQSKVFRSGGVISEKDKHLFMLKPLPDALIGAKVHFREQEYLIEAETENAEFTGVYSYVLRWCSAFDTV